ncbi:hypothetical protein THAOC_10034 [Thalassiosira oceanica]|uniref:Polysaccharide biosynthesis protein C-terminal domain-containing protein n=1 Tax=Thalassiosira oceanica TaxID=159749 RepID=K0STQ2_THAOC|nr:hypothetical protein THAOC_10034 [Thalassiosira oceanica]|mmetsp:Transcript_20505/g.46347  ORF Transcript_20505/g.46347 Transcript_20505/m.46347 type:complete len:547 (-) Transcript_20505:37-1677(-)|eukprot:EJK68760.1 hypothetical protein THAOC_10034 [Thalassiosira oceanica]
MFGSDGFVVCVAALLAVLHGGAASTCVADALSSTRPVVNRRRCWRGGLKPPTSLAASPSGEIQIDPGEEADQKRILNREFATIALPAFFQLAAEPLAGLVDTAYLGRLGPSVLGGAGVAISAQYAVSKLYNDPLLRTSISLVASQDGRSRQQGGEASDESKRKSLSIAVSSALLLAFTVGAIQLLLYFTFAGQILRGMGVGPDSPMHHSAYSYLRVRALGTPAATLWLVTNGVFRGLGDTSTPLKYSILFTCLNAVLDPLFIFSLKFGASGAAAGTAIAQYTALCPLMISLHRKVGVDVFGQLKDLGGTLKEYVKAGSYIFLRTIGKVLAYSVCARQAALLGSVAAAAYNLTFQLGFATTQLCESVAVAVQTLLARELARGEDEVDGKEKIMAARKVRHLINGSIFVGGLVAGGLSFITHLKKDSVLRGLTTDLSIREASGSVFSAVLVTQVLKGLAYPCNGIVMGGLDWKFTMLAMWLANIVCVGMVQTWARAGTVTLGKIWWALAAFMGTQVVTSILRFQSKTGVWRLLRSEDTIVSDKSTVEP